MTARAENFEAARQDLGVSAGTLKKKAPFAHREEGQSLIVF